MILKYLPEIGAAIASAIIAYYTSMPILLWLVLWAAMDLMTYDSDKMDELKADLEKWRNTNEDVY